VQAMAGREVCFAPVLSIDEAPQHPQMRSRNVFTHFDEVLHPTPAPRFSRTPSALRRPTPSPGQHSREVLAEWKVDSAQIDALEAAGGMFQAAS
jgi:alpha-methylacyl-CoA racemase